MMNTKPAIYSMSRVLLALIVLAGTLHQSTLPAAAATQFDILGPAGSVRFGNSVAVLPNGNVVVTDPHYNGGIGVKAGAVYLYHGASGALISMLTGTKAGDSVGSGGVTVLNNGNYVVSSPEWDNGDIADAGAVIWANGSSGVTGKITVTNSLVGSTAGDQIGIVTALSNGNYLVRSRWWDNGAIVNVGAVSWGNGASGVSGQVSAGNSLVGSQANDQVGYDGVIALSNGNYVVCSAGWDNGPALNAGAVTWGNGASGVTGPVSPLNSLVGSTANDQVGYWCDVTELRNGNYVVRSSYWDNGAIVDAGAVTWGNGATGVTGPVSDLNSLVGSQDYDGVGSYGVTALSNGNYVVNSPSWNNGAIGAAGAATWGDGTRGVTGPVTETNSLVGSTASDLIGSGYVVALSNGNYVVSSPYWDNGTIADTGAVTWGDGTSGVTGPATVANSLVGSQTNDRVGFQGLTALSNGNYVVSSPYWDNGAIADTGAVTWGDGTSGVAGPVTVANSLVGSQADDQVGYEGVTALSNGNYVVRSRYWDNAGIADVGAVTWGNGTGGVSGPVSALNSLVGSTVGDQVGYRAGNPGVTALSNGNYVVRSPYWDNAGIVDAGAATWGFGGSGVTGPVSDLNSLVGSQSSDQVGYDGVTALSNGNYVVKSRYWDNALSADAGAVSWDFGASGIFGSINAGNSVRGLAAGGGIYMVFQYDASNRQLVVGRPADNIVTLFKLKSYVYLPLVSK